MFGGRLGLLTAFERAGNPSTPLCPDPTAVSVTGSKPTPARRDVDDLIRNRRVRSIELSASLKDKDIPGIAQPPHRRHGPALGRRELRRPLEGELTRIFR